MKEPCDWARGPLQFGMEAVSRSIHPTPGAGACTWSIEGHKDARVKWHRELYTAGPGPLQQKAQKRMQSKWKVLLGAFPVIRGKIQRGESAREGEESEAGGERLRDGEYGWMERRMVKVYIRDCHVNDPHRRESLCIPTTCTKEQRKGRWYSTSMVWDWCMALIAFCAIALVENVTNAQPVGNKGTGSRKDKNNKTKGLDAC